MWQTTSAQFHKLQHLIVMMLGLAFLFCGFTLAVQIWRDQAEDEGTRAQYNDRLARALAAHAGASIAEIDNLFTRTILRLPDDWLTSRPAAQAVLQRGVILTPSVRNLFLLNAGGEVLGDALGRAQPGLMASDRAYLRVHVEAATDSLYITPPVISRFGDGPVQVVSRPIRDGDGRLLGVIAAVIDPGHFGNLQDGFDADAGSRMALLGQDGGIRFIDSNAPELLGRIETAALPILAQGDVRRFRSAQLFDGELRDYTVYPLRLYPLSLIVGIPPRSVQSLAAEGMASIASGLALLMIVIIAMGLVFSWHLRRSQGAIMAAEARERQFNDVARAVPGTLYQWRRTGLAGGHFAWVSEGCMRVMDLPPEDFLQRQDEFRIHPDDRQRWIDSLDAAMASDAIWNFEGRFIIPNGSERTLHAIAGSSRDNSGALILNGVVIDVTEERQSAVRMANSEGRLEMLLDAARDAIISLDADLRITHFNKGAERLFGRNAHEMLGGSLDPMLPADFRPRHAALMQHMLAGPDGAREMSSWRRVNGVRADGSVFPLLASISKTTVLGKPMLCAIMRDMSEEAASEQQLTQLADERQKLLVLAEQANEAKSKFLAVMSHELRTPLNAIIGFSELMQMKALGPIGSPKYAEYVDDILVSGRHLLAIISDILDLTKLQEHGGDFRFVDIEPVGVVEDALIFVKPRAMEKNIQIAVIDKTGGATICVDERGLRQMLINLLGNAVKYVPAGGGVAVELQSAPDDGRLIIDVLDNGPGVSDAVMARLGKPFVQDRDSYKAENSGTGLGLAIVVELASAMHARVSFRNRDEGGFCVTLEFPHVTSASRAA